MMSGMLLVNKPGGMTSHDVVQVVRRRLGIRRIGHTGTLDPMAEGLLVLLIGPATKFQRELQTHEKVYDALLQLGSQTDTADSTGQVIARADVPPLSVEQVRDVLRSLEGPLVQQPPMYSAVKVRGKPAYWWARRQRPVQPAPRTIQIFSAQLRSLDPPAIACRIHCSAGTYVRTLAETVAERLGTVGHLAKLTRVRLGGWRIDDAISLDWIRTASAEDLQARVLSVAGQAATRSGTPRSPA